MLSTLILAAALGQCPGGVCAHSAYRPAPVYRMAPARPAYRAPVTTPKPVNVAPRPAYRPAPVYLYAPSSCANGRCGR